jgi:hypothetical protein
MVGLRDNDLTRSDKNIMLGCLRFPQDKKSSRPFNLAYEISNQCASWANSDNVFPTKGLPTWKIFVGDLAKWFKVE